MDVGSEDGHVEVFQLLGGEGAVGQSRLVGRGVLFPIIENQQVVPGFYRPSRMAQVPDHGLAVSQGLRQPGANGKFFILGRSGALVLEQSRYPLLLIANGIVQGGAAVFVLGIGVGPVFEQQGAYFSVALGGGHMQGGAKAFLVLEIHPGAGCEQKCRDLHFSLARRQAQRPPAVLADRVDIGALFNQQGDYFWSAMQDGVVQGGGTETGLPVHRQSFFQHEFDDFRRFLVGRLVKQRESSPAAPFQIGTLLQQQLDHVGLARPQRVVDGRGLIGGLDVDVGAPGDEESGQLQVASLGGVDQRCLFLNVQIVDGRSFADQVFDDLQVATLGRPMERRFFVVTLGVEQGRVLGQQFPDQGQVALESGIMDLGRPGPGGQHEQQDKKEGFEIFHFILLRYFLFWVLR